MTDDCGIVILAIPSGDTGLPSGWFRTAIEADSHALLRTVISVEFLVTAIHLQLFSRALSVSAGLGLRTWGTSGGVISRSLTVAALGDPAFGGFVIDGSSGTPIRRGGPLLIDPGGGASRAPAIF